MSVSSKVLATFALSIFWLAAAVAQPPEYPDTEPQTYDPIDLVIENAGLVTGCDALETHCEISTVLETDEVYIVYRYGRTITAAFQLEAATPSDFYIEISSWAYSSDMPAEVISLRNLEGDFVKREVVSSVVGDLMLTLAYITYEDAEDYIDPTGRVEVRVEKNTGGTSPQGDSDRWVDEIDIVIPPT